MTDKDIKYSEFLANNNINKQLKDKSLSGGIWIMAGQAGGHSLRMLSIIILARILTPSDYGLIAMVAVLTNFIQMFKDIGLNVATVQSKEITHAEVSNLFWFNTGISTVLGIIVAACAPVVTWFYGREELLYITLTLAITFPVSGLIIQHIALLQRQLRYKQISIIQILSIIIGIISAIAAAYAGLGYWSLVIMELSGVLSTSLLAIWFCRWIPSLPDRNTKTAHFLKFGGYLTGSNFCEYFSNNLDKLIIGKTLNPAILGQYTKAFDLSLLPLRKISYPLNNLAIATLSKLQDEPKRYRHYYTFAQETLVIAIVPFFALGFACSESLFKLFLGNQWNAAAPIFSWFCLLSLATACTSSTRWLFLSQGRAKEFLYFTLLSAFISAISFFIGIRYGIMGITIGYTLATIFIRTPLVIYISSRSGAVGVMDQVRCFTPTLLLSGIMAAIIIITQQLLETDSDILRVLIAIGVYIICFMTAFIINKRWRERISKLAELFFNKAGMNIPKVFDIKKN